MTKQHYLRAMRFLLNKIEREPAFPGEEDLDFFDWMEQLDDKIEDQSIFAEAIAS